MEDYRQQFCVICKMHNCSKHSDNLTKRLNNLLEHFEEPEDNMRTFIDLTEKKEPSQQPANSKEPSITAPESSSIKFSNPPKSTALVTLSDVIHKPKLIQSGDDVIRTNNHKHKSHEKHHFININNSSFISCSSPSGMYSEITIILWVDSKNYSRYSSDRFKIVLNLMYDSLDDIWSISSKLIKRASYYGKDEEEGQISNRLCFTDELKSEIKKMLLFMKVSPREAYRLLRRNMNEDFVITDNNGFLTVECASHASFMKEFEKFGSFGHETDHYTHRNHNYHQHGQHNVNERNSIQRDKGFSNGIYEYP